MPVTYADFYREPSKTHQCMHFSEEDGTRCRCRSMHNEFMCYQHRCNDIRTVLENDPFLLENLLDHDAIQKAVGDVASRLACNNMDLKRAGLLLQSIQIAASRLTALERHQDRVAAAQATAAAVATNNLERTTDDAPPATTFPPPQLATNNQQLTTALRPFSEFSEDEAYYLTNTCLLYTSRSPIHVTK